MLAYIRRLHERQNLSRDESRAAFDALFAGKVPDEQIAAFLLALKDKGEMTDEIIGAVTSLRAHMIPMRAPAGCMDIVGTGGDGHGTLNVSTAAAFVVAACGVPVAKHGNRAVSSQSGASDVLAVLGVNLDAPLPVVEKILAEHGIAFLFAPNHHPAMRHVAAVRKKLKTRTLFNLLGPLTNPASVKYHLIGVYDPRWMEPTANVLRDLGSRTAWIACGQDGMDEITTTTATDIVAFQDSASRRFTLTPEEAGLPRASLADLKGGDAAHNAAALRLLLEGKKSAYRDIVLLNAAAALCVVGKAANLQEGLCLASEAVDRGAAREKLERLVRDTQTA